MDLSKMTTDKSIYANGKDDGDDVIYSQARELSTIPLETREDVTISPETDKPKWNAPLVNIEPVIFLFVVAAAFQDPTLNALVYEKVCYSHFSANICTTLHNKNHSGEEDVVQGESSHWMLYHNFCYEIPAIVLALLYGSFSDNVSRRAAIALPCIGQSLCGISFIINSYYMHSPVVYTLIGQVVSGLTGGWIACFMAMFSYLGEATSAENRSLRVMIAEGVAAIGSSISLVTSGVLLDNTNYITVFALAASLNALAAIYCFVWLREPPKRSQPTKKSTNIFNLFWVKFRETLECVFRWRENNGRKRLIAALIVVLTGMISFNVIYKVGYLFLRRQPLSWTQSMYGYFAAVYHFLPGIGMLVIIPLLQKKFNIRDTTLMILGILSSAISEFYLSFCVKTWMVWLVPVMCVMKGGTWVVRSVVSKLVDTSELGAMYAALGALQAISGMVGAAVYNSIYPLTLSFWPGLCFVLGTGLAVVPLSLTIWLRIDFKKTQNYETLTNNMSVQGKEDAPLVTRDTQSFGHGSILFI